MNHRTNLFKGVFQVIAVAALLAAPTQAVFADESATIRYFDEVKGNQPLLTAFLKEICPAMPAS
ncbi:hypothetical protein GTO91_08690 [Heliobacterium undosum]|uniref:Uncharacterized protein n=1 Tax=Heliomicrobium undosum TaxID=121734 RepID=A0A845LA49_9FIRM|nr:hypothetical protein [Heliomicrobium undosum]MZP29781.1 hypothetical protein [Heliomicrobium undosum]